MGCTWTRSAVLFGWGAICGGTEEGRSGGAGAGLAGSCPEGCCSCTAAVIVKTGNFEFSLDLELCMICLKPHADHCEGEALGNVPLTLCSALIVTFCESALQLDETPASHLHRLKKRELKVPVLNFEV